MIRLVEDMLQPLTHKIKHASARSSHRGPLPYPLLPLHSMFKVANLFPFGGGAIKTKIYLRNLDCYRGLSFTFGFLLLLLYILFKSCIFLSSHRITTSVFEVMVSKSQNHGFSGASGDLQRFKVQESGPFVQIETSEACCIHIHAHPPKRFRRLHSRTHLFYKFVLERQGRGHACVHACTRARVRARIIACTHA